MTEPRRDEIKGGTDGPGTEGTADLEAPPVSSGRPALAATRVGSPLIAGIVNSAANTGAAWLGQIRTLTLLASASLTKSFFPTRGFRPGF